MAVDERSRHRLRLRLAEVLGEAEAQTLMDDLPPAEWGAPATRQELAGLAAALRAQIEALGERITSLDERLAERMAGIDARTADVERRNIELDHRLVQLEDRLVDRIDSASRDVLASIRVDLGYQARTFAFAQLGSVIAVGTLVLAAVHLT